MAAAVFPSHPAVKAMLAILNFTTDTPKSKNALSNFRNACVVRAGLTVQYGGETLVRVAVVSG